MGDITITVGNAKSLRLANANRKFLEYLRTLQREMLKQEAALAARAFIKFSPPIPQGGGMGDTGKAYKQGEIAVERDIRSIVAPRSATLASAVADIYGSREAFDAWRSKGITRNSGRVIEAIHQDKDADRAYTRARNLFGSGNTGGRILQDISEVEALHKKQRQIYRGRITRNRGPSQDIKAKPYFAEPKHINKYVKMQQRLVGTLQSGWLMVINRIGTVKLRGQYLSSGTKGVASRLYKLAGTGTFTLREGSRGFVFNVDSSATIRNPMGNVNGVGDEARTKEKVIEYRLNQLASRPYQRFLNDGIRRFNNNTL